MVATSAYRKGLVTFDNGAERQVPVHLKKNLGHKKFTKIALNHEFDRESLQIPRDFRRQ